MKKVTGFVLAMILCFGLFAGTTVSAAQAESDVPEINGVRQDITEYLWEIPEEADQEEYIRLMTRNFRIIQAFELLFTEESYDAYSRVYSRQFKRTQSYEDAVAVVEAQSLLEQHTSIAEGAWFLWGTGPEDNANGFTWHTAAVGPVISGEETELTEAALDNSEIDGFGQGPVLIKCLLEDPSQARGNIILISGGGFSTRSNPAEGYAAIPAFQELGYNTFLLQRRVAPFSIEDIAMDLQRAIRLVRYYARQEGWGGQDMVAAAGFSGGGSTIAAAINTAYGELTPAEEGAEGYIPDIVDQENSDLDVAMLIYGASSIETDNPRIPPIYMAVGTKDSTGAYDKSVALYEQYKDIVPVELYVVEGASHGFGVGQSAQAPEECALWPGQADEFMQNFREAGSSLPEKYTKAKSFYGFYTFTDSDVYFAMNEDETEFHAEYTVMHSPNVIEGTVENGVVTVTYNAIGFADDDAQMMYDDAMDLEEAWEPIER